MYAYLPDNDMVNCLGHSYSIRRVSMEECKTGPLNYGRRTAQRLQPGLVKEETSSIQCRHDVPIVLGTHCPTLFAAKWPIEGAVTRLP